MPVRWRPILLAVLLGAAAASAVAAVVVLPVVRFSVAPVLVVIPQTYVYAIPDRDDDFFFYEDFWWRPYGGLWHRSASYNGPWVVVERVIVPAPLVRVPPGWRKLPPGLTRVPYGQVRSNWRKWHKEKYWEKDPHWRVAPPPGHASGPPPGKAKQPPPSKPPKKK